MKKYIKPVSQIVEMETTQMLDGSPGTHNELSTFMDIFADERDEVDSDDEEDLW